jgi:hypothetical protein
LVSKLFFVAKVKEKWRRKRKEEEAALSFSDQVEKGTKVGELEL